MRYRQRQATFGKLPNVVILVEFCLILILALVASRGGRLYGLTVETRPFDGAPAIDRTPGLSPVLLTVAADGGVHVRGRSDQPADLTQFLAELKKGTPVVVTHDPGAPAEAVQQLFARCKVAGLVANWADLVTGGKQP